MTRSVHPRRLLWLLGPASLALACGFGPESPAPPSAPSVAQAAGTTPAPSASRLAAVTPTPAVPDPANDEVLAYIDASVKPDDATWQKLVALYQQFRADQSAITQKYQAMLPGGGAGAGAGAGGGMAAGGRPAGPPPEGRPLPQRPPGAGAMGNRPPPGAGGRPGGAPGGQGRLQQTISAARAEYQALEQAFLANGRAALTTDAQRHAWDLCASSVDLGPPTTGGPLDEVRFDPNAGPQVGDLAPDFTLTSIDGGQVSLSSFRGRPVVLEFGSYTCPAFRETATKLQPLIAQYGRNVAFVVVYGPEAHPSDGWVAPQNLAAGISIPQHRSEADRQKCALDARSALKLDGATILIDGLDNAVVKAWGGHPNRSYIVDPSGKVVARNLFSDPEETKRILSSM